VTQYQVLGAGRRADGIGLDEVEPVERPPERGGPEEAAGDSKSAEVVERQRTSNSLVKARVDRAHQSVSQTSVS
jgi:hypothetical protein